MEQKDTGQQDKEQRLFKYCIRCGRKLVSMENRQRGMGDTCWEKWKVQETKKGSRLF